MPELDVSTFYGSVFANSTVTGLPPSVFWAHATAEVDLIATLSDQVGGNRIGIAGNLARTMAMTNGERQIAFEELLSAVLFETRPVGITLASKPTRFRAMTESAIGGVLAVIQIQLPGNPATGTPASLSDPYLTVVGCPCVSERGDTRMGAFLWPNVAGVAPLLQPGGFQRAPGMVFPIAGTMVHNSRTAPRTRNEWIEHQLSLFSLDGTPLDVFICPSSPAVSPPTGTNSLTHLWGTGDDFRARALDTGATPLGDKDITLGRIVTLPRTLLLPGNFHLPLGQIWSCSIGLQGFITSLREMAMGMDPTIGDWLNHPLVEEFFAAVADDPLDFATTWTWSVDMATSLIPAGIRAPLCLNYPPACLARLLHRDYLLATLPVSARRKFEQYEKNAQAATFLDPLVYMGGADRSQLCDLWCFRRPNQKAWRDTMGLASFIDQHCDPVGHADYLRFVIPPFNTPVILRPWATEAEARASLALADTEEDVDDPLALAFISGILAAPAPSDEVSLPSPRRATRVVGPPSRVPPPARLGLVGGTAASHARSLSLPIPRLPRNDPMLPAAASDGSTVFDLTGGPTSVAFEALNWRSTPSTGILRGEPRGFLPGFSGRSSPTLKRSSVPVSSLATGGAFAWPSPVLLRPAKEARTMLSALPGGDPGAPSSIRLDTLIFDVESPDLRIRSNSMVVLLLVSHNPTFAGWTTDDVPIPMEAALFPQKLAERWSQAVHLPDKSQLVGHFLQAGFRGALTSDLHSDIPRCNPIFFEERTMKPFATGLWLFSALPDIEEEDYRSTFGMLHFLLMLPGSTYPPRIPQFGLTLADLDSLISMIHCLFSLATGSWHQVKQGVANPYDGSLLAQHLAHISDIMRTRNFHTTMKTRPFECSVMVLSYIARLFDIFFRWISGAPGLHLASDVDSTNIPMVDGTIYGPRGVEGDILSELEAWRAEASLHLTSHQAIGFMKACTDDLPAFLFHKPTASARTLPVIPGAGAPDPTPRGRLKGSPLVSTTPLAPTGASPPVYTADVSPLFTWAIGCEPALMKKPAGEALLRIRKEDPTNAVPAFKDIAAPDPAKATKQVCFAYCLAGTRGCDGTMPGRRRGAAAPLPRAQPCNRAHIDLSLAAWTRSATPESYAHICAWLKLPVVQKYFAPSAAFAASPLYTG